MKHLKTLSVITLLGCIFIYAENSEARESRARLSNQKLGHEKAILLRQAAPQSHYSASDLSTESTESGNRFGLGFSTVGNVLPDGNAAITALMNFDDKNTLQGFFSMPTLSSVVGAFLYKRTISGTQEAGFHLGGGFGLAGSDMGGGAFLMNLSAVAGFHFELPGISHVLAHLDGGPSFTLINTAGTAMSSFSVAALSPALGASIVYLF